MPGRRRGRGLACDTTKCLLYLAVLSSGIELVIDDKRRNFGDQLNGFQRLLCRAIGS